MKTPKAPKWLTEEIEELGKGVYSGELDREEALSTLTDHVLDKEADLVRELVASWVSGKLQAKVNARKQEGLQKVDQLLSGVFQPGFDEICSDFWSRESYGPLTPLEELEKYHHMMSGMTSGFVRRDEERGRRLQELIDAAEGDKTVAWGVAELRRLGITPEDNAAEG